MSNMHMCLLCCQYRKIWSVTQPMVPPPIGLPGPHAAVMDGPPGPCTATTLSPGGPSTALSITTVGPPLPRIVSHCCTETLVGVAASETNRAPKQCACPYYSLFAFTWQLKWFM